MSRVARVISESGVYHIVFRGVNQQNIFEEDADFKKLKETIRTVKQDMNFEIYAYCFMSDRWGRTFFVSFSQFYTIW